MPLTTHVIYDSSTGEIASVCTLDTSEPAPTPPAGHAGLDLGSVTTPIPSRTTHKVDLAGPTLVAKTQGEMDAERDAELREHYRRKIGMLECIKEKYLAESPPWDTAKLDAEIADVRVLHDALP